MQTAQFTDFRTAPKRAVRRLPCRDDAGVWHPAEAGMGLTITGPVLRLVDRQLVRFGDRYRPVRLVA